MMNEDSNNLDHSEEDILVYEVSDEALEAAAGKVGDQIGTLVETRGGDKPCCPL